MISKEKLIKSARHYLNKGISVVATDAKKKPNYSWFKLQKKRLSFEEVEAHFQGAEGIGVICGNISNGLFAIDIDTKYFDEHISYEEIVERVPSEILNKLVVQETRSGGKHWVFKMSNPLGNKKLAMRETTEAERKGNPNEKVKVLIETRGEGGFICIYPTSNYKIISENKQINRLSQEEVEVLLNICYEFNRVWDEVELYERVKEEKNNKFLVSPFDDADVKLDLLGFMLSKGYKRVGRENASGVKLLRPGATSSTHSGYYHPSTNKYANFSTSTEFENGKLYSASAVFTILECNGDWKQSYKKFLEMGYGVNVDFEKRINNFIKEVKENNFDYLLKEVFDAKKEGDLYIVNNKYIKVD